MAKYFVALMAIAAVGVCVDRTFAHQAAEIYIPVGRSPGLSGKYTSIGTVEAADAADEWILMEDSTGSLTVHCTAKTRFYLDKSKIRARNEVGSIEDCREGRTIEIRYVDDDRAKAVAEWIKIEIPAGS